MTVPVIGTVVLDRQDRMSKKDAFVERIRAKSDAELRQMLLEDAANYRKEAMDEARREARQRGLSLDPTSTPVSPALSTPGNQFSAAGRQITCALCGGTLFVERRILLDERTSRYVQWEMHDAIVAQLLSCVLCGRMEWFEGECRPGPVENQG
jgi:hypothetical protein